MKIKILFYLTLLASGLIFTGCQKDPEIMVTAASDPQDLKAGAGTIKIAILSDIHVMDPSLLADPTAYWGVPFQTYLAADPKLLGESVAILTQAIAQVNRDKPDLLLITGDLTKDGEAQSHRKAVNMLGSMLDPKIKVLVIPGNHDLNNPNAKKFYTTYTKSVPTYTSENFAFVYEDFGFKDAIARDPNSLSYVSEPYKNLRVIAIDACQYGEFGKPYSGAGMISEETMAWIQEQMEDAVSKHMQVIAMMHHMLLPHYQGQELIDPGFVLNDWETRSTQLMNMGLNVIFTGHYHANDIVVKKSGGKFVYDIGTGSTVSSPLPYRLVKYQNNGKIEVTTKYVTGISFNNTPVQDYARQFLAPRLVNIFYYMLSSPPYNLTPDLAAQGAPLCKNGFMAHYAGDEYLTPNEQEAIMSFWNNIPDSNTYKFFILQTLMTWWSDLTPADNYYYCDLTTGK